MNIFTNKHKKLSIVLITVVIILLIFLILSLTGHAKTSDESLTSSSTATPESATSDLETNADGYGEETLTLTDDGSYLDGEASDEENGLTDEETSEQPEATATPQLVQATPDPVAATPAPVQNDIPQQTVNQPDQSYDDGAVPDWVDTSDTPLVSDEEYNAALDAWDDSVSFE